MGRCEKVFGLRIETLRYCSVCERGFCPMHGNFAHGHGECIICGTHNDDRLRKCREASRSEQFCTDAKLSGSRK